MILKSTTEKPSNVGVLFVIDNNGKKTTYNYTGSTISFITLREQYSHYIDESITPAYASEYREPSGEVSRVVKLLKAEKDKANEIGLTSEDLY